jgi:hypothetical protein
MPFGFHLRCAVNRECWFVGGGWDFESYEESEYFKGLFAELGETYWISIRELLAMTELALQILDPELCDRRDEMARALWEARQDQETLRIIETLNQPLEAALEVWSRSLERMRWMAERCADPAKRQQIEAMIEEREAAMDALIARAQARELASQAKAEERGRANGKSS